MNVNNIKANIRKSLKALYYKLPFLWNNALAINGRLYLDIVLNKYRGRDVREDAVSFYGQNAEIVNSIANMLADKKSKKIYLGMIKFRQTHSIKDFPFHCVNEPEYFINELVFSPNEVFIDGGAYTGDTIDQFLKYHKKYAQIIAFEPDTEIFKKLKEKHGNNPLIMLVNAGLYDKNGEISFSNSGTVWSRVTNDGSGVSIQVQTIDGLDIEKVTFIKLDIEGSELYALKGAEKTILRDKPKLAICIYHSNGDMINIIRYIHNLVPEYRLYVRQYAYGTWSTVLYAIMP